MDDDVSRIRAVIGDELTDKLQLELGGQELYFAENPTHDADTVRVLGVDAVRKIAEELGRGECFIPMGRFGLNERTRIKILEYLREDLTQRQVALKAGVHLRTVERTVSLLKHGKIK